MSLASLGGGSPAPLPPALKPSRAQDAADPCSGDDPTTTVSSDSSSPRTRIRGLAPAPLSLTLQRKLPCPFLPLPAADHAHFSAPPPMAPGQTPHSSLSARSPQGGAPDSPPWRGHAVCFPPVSMPGPATKHATGVCRKLGLQSAPAPEELGLAGLGSRRTVAPAPGHMRSFSTEPSPRVTRSCVTVGFLPQLEHPRLQWPQFTEQLLHQPMIVREPPGRGSMSKTLLSEGHTQLHNCCCGLEWSQLLPFHLRVYHPPALKWAGPPPGRKGHVLIDT